MVHSCSTGVRVRTSRVSGRVVSLRTCVLLFAGMKDECTTYMRHWGMMAALTLGFAGTLEAGQPKRISMVVGHTITVSMPAPVTRVKLSDQSLVDVSQNGRKVKFVGRMSGVTDVVVTTSDGETRLQLYVASDKYALP